MIQPDTLDKLRLCVLESITIGDILKAKKCDGTLGRILSIYVAMRLDDFTKYMNHSLPADHPNRPDFDELFKRYNYGYRRLRDKFGSHFQSFSDHADMMERVESLSAITYAETISLIDTESTLFELVSGESDLKGFATESDLNHILGLCDKLNMTSQAQLSNDLFAFAEVNKGFVITCSQAQQKCQVLRTLQLMESLLQSLCGLRLESQEAQRIFKRYLVCVVINFCDNLYTRTDISPKSPQYDPGLDSMITSLITKRDNAELIEKSFSYYKERHTNALNFIKQLRDARDQSCGHLDEDKSINDINAQLDQVCLEDTMAIYESMLAFFENLTNTVFLLQSCALSPRVNHYQGQFESIDNNGGFYQDDSAQEIVAPEEPTLELLFRHIRKHTPQEAYAHDCLKQIIGFHDDSRFKSEVVTYLTSRFTEPNLTTDELVTLINLLYSCRGGYPSRIVTFILDTLALHVEEDVQISLLWLLSQLADSTEDKRTNGIIHSILTSQAHPVVIAFALNIHMSIILRAATPPMYFNRDVDVDPQIIDEIRALTDVRSRLAILVSLLSRWESDTHYSIYRQFKQKYQTFLLEEVKTALADYCKWAKIDNDTYTEMNVLIDEWRFVQLNYELILRERERNQQKNIFLSMFAYCAIQRHDSDPYEKMFAALSYEHSGKLDLAFNMLAELVRSHPNDRCFPSVILQYTKHHKMVEAHDKYIRLFKLLGMDVKE